MTFDSTLPPESFARTTVGAIIKSDYGYRAEHSDSARRWEFSRWLWEGTFVDAGSGTVCYTAPGIEAACIADALDSRTAARLCSVFQAAEEQGIDLSGRGAGAIYAGTDGAFYFLPGETYRMATEIRAPQEYARLQGCYVNPLLYDAVPSMQFTQGVFAYYALTQTLPFTETDRQERHADFFDGNYVRPEHRINGLNAELARAINLRLQLRPDSAGAQPLPPLTEADVQGTPIEETLVQDELRFAKAVERFYKRLHTQLAVRRYLRRNRIQLTFAGAVAALLLVVGGSWLGNVLRQPTARGLTALQTVELFYSGMNRLEVPCLKAASRGKAAQDYVVITSGFYVTAKTRESVDQQNGTVSPAEWLYFKGDTTFWLYGLTDFRIDGSPADAERVPERICDFPPEAQDLGSGARTFTAEYYLVQSEAPGAVALSRHTDTLTLEARGGSWQITGIEGRVQNLSCDVQALRGDLAALSAQNPGMSVPELAAVLRQDSRYAWLPSPAEMHAGARKAAARFNLSAAQAEL